MIIYKLTLTISGDRFQSSSVVLSESELRIEDLWEADSPIKPFRAGKHIGPVNQVYGYGGMMLMNNRCWGATDVNKEQYESDFVDFLLRNESAFLHYGAQEAELFYEILHEEGETCNAAVYSAQALKKLGKLSLSVSLPISVYQVDKLLFSEYMNEIKVAWGK